MNLFPPGILDLGRTVGVRPENIKLYAADAVADKGFAATVDIVEALGSETLVHCITEDRGVKVTVRLQNKAATVAAAGARVVLVPDMAKAVVFDRA